MNSSCISEQVKCYATSTNPFTYCDCPPIKADSDIAGQGVLSAFMASALLTILLSIACLVFKEDYNFTQLNELDKLFRLFVCRPLHKRSNYKLEVWADRLYPVVLSLSDSQLVTGIAMLASAIKLMNDGSITAYHFNIVSDLAWFSSITHLMTLLVIRVFMGSQKPSKEHCSTTSTKSSNRGFTHHDMLRYIRICLMVIMAAMLLYVCYLLGVERLYDDFNCPMKCLARSKRGGTPLKWSRMNFSLIIWSYPVSIIQIIPTFTRSWLVLRCKIEKLHYSIDKNLEGTSFEKILKRAIYRTLKMIFVVFWQFLASETEDILEGIAWFVVGVISVIQDRDLANPNDAACMSPIEWKKQNEWGFGQLVPLFLLFLPVLSFVEAWNPEGNR
ncbi:hypothetical protein DM02DRAFT_655140 [Periconia macrospinosa]|uniref:Uncharacterized protein n=1 Tax=Periconia macrospinosa TaxID=97972 RepID=A0A2V1DR82_9PLEO|nr:hypothetical protein DM02DRAFT_655140 [Periconia macrospinosa]